MRRRIWGLSFTAMPSTNWLLNSDTRDNCSKTSRCSCFWRCSHIPYFSCPALVALSALRPLRAQGCLLAVNACGACEVTHSLQRYPVMVKCNTRCTTRNGQHATLKLSGASIVVQHSSTCKGIICCATSIEVVTGSPDDGHSFPVSIFVLDEIS